ncbi:MAG: ROK family protein, partial [Chloroflexota bacterium]|nr:ROK family protein [Chloroflexota bacterium]
LVQTCVVQLNQSRSAAEADALSPAALAISAPGPLDPWKGILIDPPNMHRSLWGFDLVAALADRLRLPAAIERDTQVAALAEQSYGAAKGLSDFIYLTVSTGVGGAVVSDGRLLRGPDGVAGELGHMVVDMDGPPCGCGSRGHLEAFASGTGIVAAVRAALAAGDISSDGPLGRQISERGETALGARDVAQADAAGDPVAARIMEQARQAFAAAVVSMVDIFNPQRIIVGGGVANGQGERLLGPARERVRRESFRSQARRVEIVAGGLGDDVGLLGAVPLVRLAGLKPNATRPDGMAFHSDPAAGDDVNEQATNTDDQRSAAAAPG